MSSERHCLKVRVTEKIREFLRASLDEKEIKTKLEEKILQELEQSLETYSEGEITEESKSNEFCEKELKFSSLKRVFELYKEAGKLDSIYFSQQGKIFIHQLLSGSDVYFSPPKKPERNPELAARLEKIQHKLDNLAYSKMVSNLGEKQVDHGNLAIDMKSLNIQAIHAFNILLSFVCAFAFGFATGYYNGLDNGLSAIIGVSLCIPVLLADMYFLLKYYDDGSRMLERREEELKLALSAKSVTDKKND